MSPNIMDLKHVKISVSAVTRLQKFAMLRRTMMFLSSFRNFKKQRKAYVFGYRLLLKTSNSPWMIIRSAAREETM